MADGVVISENKGPGGRPALYETPELINQAIDLYFRTCEAEKKRSTITRLAYALGFESRQSFYDYEERGEFSYIIKRARLRVEADYEDGLRENNCTGSIFALKNMGWKDKIETALSNPDGTPLSPSIVVQPMQLISAPPIEEKEDSTETG